ncbi:MAG: tetratricopeptide repeat protein [Flavobacterium sp.]|uniref:tetratricopeptide repeat-containing sensor histidine kinase n=1 Tax=Flavobacterium sp. TaxID=239 RepID=UPI00120D94E2|nr:tetratricopeptide repeat protein [Flavobacterium sp.]RZJ67798.1 MAG: tetratricopeptide repeat protein [Flavobacterium sp.]
MRTNFKHLTLSLAIALPVFCGAQQVQADSLKRVIRAAKTDTVKVNAFNKLSLLYRDSQLDSSVYYAKQAETLAAKNQYGFGQASAWINQGNAKLLTGRYPEALQLFQQAQNRFSGLLQDDEENSYLKNNLARAHASIAVVYSEQSNYSRALSNYQEALRLFTETGNKAMQSKAYNNIAIVYKSQTNLDKALEYLNKAFALQQETGEQAAATTLMNIGVIHYEKGNIAEAKKYYDRSKILFDETDNKRGSGLLYNYYGDYYSKTGNNVAALENYNKSVGIYEELSNKFGASLALYNIGKLHADGKLFAIALPFAQKSLDYAKEIANLDQQYHSEKLLSEIYDGLDQPDKALTHYKHYISARDSIVNAENTKKFALAEMDFEYQKKEALLHEKNKRQTQFMILSGLAALLLIGLIIAIYNRRQVKRRLTLQKEVAEYEQKALHLQMNPHFVFNCLGSISSFIVQNGTDSALKYLSKFSKLMRLTLEYSKGSLIPIDKEIESLQNYLELEQLRFHNKFTFEIRSSEKVEFNMGLPPLLVQPFVENAILHGMVPKEGNGNISVDFDVENGQLVCTIQDDGIGLSQSIKLKENSVTAHKSMALEITRKRLEIMESTTAKSAQIDISETSENGETGTRVRLRLPIQYMP